MNSNTIKNLLFCVVFSLILSCKSVSTVDFKNPSDTTHKPIALQVKQTYVLEDLGVYASNRFNGARLNGFEKENDSTALVIITPENSPINNSAYFAFKVWSTNSTDFYLKFQYPKGYKHRYAPKLRVNNNWSIIDSTNIVKQDSTVIIKVHLTNKPILIAAQEVQSSNDVERWYTNLVKEKNDFVKLRSVGKTTLKRNLPVLDIYRGKKEKKDVIVLLTRQHPPEITGYFAFQTFLETILNDSELSLKFINRYRILAFPIMNPDGVDLGHWRHNAAGVDLNRDWSVYNQLEIKQAVQFINKELKKGDSKLVLGLDFHSTYQDVFYTNEIRESTTLPNFINDWFIALEENISNYKVNEKSKNSTYPVSKGWFLYGHNAAGITYEIGDKTSKENIKNIGSVSANEMMKILLREK